MQILRISPRGLEFHINEVLGGTHCEIRIVGSDKKITVEQKLEVLSAAWYRWQMQNMHIQNAFPFLKPSEREFILTGITPEEWNVLFPPEDGGKVSAADKEYEEYSKNFPNSDPRD